MGKLINMLNLEDIKKTENELVPAIFTRNQIKIIKKRLANKKLTANERSNLYRTINKKLKAIKLLLNYPTEFVYGEQFILKDKLEKAKQILKKIERNHKNLKILISGSYLWKRKHRDIDIFIITKYNKEDYIKENLHINYLPIGIENSIFFNSISQIAISNFKIEQRFKFKINLDDLLMLYQELISYISQKQDFKQELREFLLYCAYLSENIILNSKQLDYLIQKIIYHEYKIEIINRILIKTLLIAFSYRILFKKIRFIINSNKDIIKEYQKADNLKIYNRTLKGVMEIAKQRS